MERRDFGLRVFAYDVGKRDDRDPIVVALFARLEAVHREAAGQARDSTKDGLKRLGLVMGDKVLVDLDRSHPRLSFIGDSGLTANAHDQLVVLHAID